ncbi:hypothetical protein NG798_14600 [Ancylothrix sp. C2]|uniref:hypothetical protein n=1 Tax=Ancylothrix sp. D3o TaxID=2953691 RepID=UPI0021BAE347|nr:hypothetical protein [Ancylothrix sp. D3o]MCT7951025.1 hypothetical protein [Ancylothrix sp. D3o]
MPEDAGKKRILRDFLHQVSQGNGFIEDIWIEREVRKFGTDGQYNTANSLSGWPISNLTELLKDDIKHNFEEGFFTFRFIAATPGSGKTALLNYFRELIRVEPKHSVNSVVVNFSLNDLLAIAGKESFGVKLYCHILVQTLWELLKNGSQIKQNVKTSCEDFLKEILKTEQFAQLQQSTSSDNKFSELFTEYLLGKHGVNFEQLFFKLIDGVKQKEPAFRFVYLIDELDALKSHAEYMAGARAIIRALINRSFDKYQGKVQLMMYVVGISDDVDKFIQSDAALAAKISGSTVMLVPFRREECEKIKEQITKRIKDAYSGCQDFKQAWQEIEAINVEPGKDCHTLRDFCQKYGGKVKEIHEKYFNHFDKNFNVYENKARDLVEAKCREKWATFLKQKQYEVKVYPTTTSITCDTPNGHITHAFDCYVELLHNGYAVAKAFGEAKNYDLLSKHLTTFDEWLKDAKFTPFSVNGNPPDLAFIIAPSCQSLLLKKLEIKNIEFIQADKQLKLLLDSIDQILHKVDNPELYKIDHPEPPLDGEIDEAEPKKAQPIGNQVPPTKPVNINTASKEELVQAFRGVGMRQNTIDLIIELRQDKRHTDLHKLIEDVKSTDNVKQKLQTKLDNGEICF